MRKIVEYRLAVGDDDEKELSQQVNHLIADGFQPLGGVATTTTREAFVCFVQAMVKYGGDESSG